MGEMKARCSGARRKAGIATGCVSLFFFTISIWLAIGATKGGPPAPATGVIIGVVLAVRGLLEHGS